MKNGVVIWLGLQKVGIKRPSGPQLMGKILCGQLRYGDVAGRAIKRLTPFG
jgi:hypothetical protein